MKDKRQFAIAFQRVHGEAIFLPSGSFLLLAGHYSSISILQDLNV